MFPTDVYAILDKPKILYNITTESFNINKPYNRLSQ